MSPRYSLSLHKDAENDLDTLWENDPDSAAVIEAFLEEAADSQDMLDRFSGENYEDTLHSPSFNITRWKKLWKDHPLWRVRLFYVPAGAASRRIVYTFHVKEQRYYILGIIPRDFNYELSHPLTKRIIRACQALGVA